jgi:hypothetical protein
MRQKALSENRPNLRAKIRKSLRNKNKSEKKARLENKLSKMEKLERKLNSNKREDGNIFMDLVKRVKLSDIESDLSEVESAPRPKKTKKRSQRSNDMGTKFRYPIPIESGYHYQATIPKFDPRVEFN